MIYYYNKYKGVHHKSIPDLKYEDIVTIQLPIYNELYVIERLIDAVCKINYPKDKFEIQVLDDSTDETIELAKRIVEDKKKQGYDITYIHREDRE